jgi:uncharacterized DUF497 family protein
VIASSAPSARMAPFLRQDHFCIHRNIDSLSFCRYIFDVKITYDPAKRARTLEDRGLDFEDCIEVFSGVTVDAPDLRHEYREPRFKTVGLLTGRMMVVIWTPRDGSRRIISMRKANEREKAIYRQRLGEV